MVLRKPMVAGNWKMNGTRAEVASLAEAIKQGVQKQNAIDVVVFPTFIHIPQVEQLLSGSPIAWGGQNMYLGASGAMTGEVAGNMLVEFVCNER